MPLGDAVRVIQALRKGPRSAREIAEATGLPWRRVYRLIEALRKVGAPVQESEGDMPARGFAPARFVITAQGLRGWLE